MQHPQKHVLSKEMDLAKQGSYIYAAFANPSAMQKCL